MLMMTWWATVVPCLPSLLLCSDRCTDRRFVAYFVAFVVREWSVTLPSLFLALKDDVDDRCWWWAIVSFCVCCCEGNVRVFLLNFVWSTIFLAW
jgi:hypothetical protein